MDIPIKDVVLEIRRSLLKRPNFKNKHRVLAITLIKINIKIGLKNQGRFSKRRFTLILRPRFQW